MSGRWTRFRSNEWQVDSVYLLVNGYELTCGHELDGGFDLVST
jgi:hypothetical protein